MFLRSAILLLSYCFFKDLWRFYCCY